jgi:hypothetical protein
MSAEVDGQVETKARYEKRVSHTQVPTIVSLPLMTPFEAGLVVLSSFGVLIVTHMVLDEQPGPSL